MTSNEALSASVWRDHQDLGAIGNYARRKHRSIGRMIAGAVVLLLLALFGLSVANAKFDWSVVRTYLVNGQILGGIERTLLLTVLAMLVGLVLGTLGGVCRLSRNPVVSGVAWLYVWFFRGTPVLVQLLLWFNLSLIFPHLSIPGLFSVSMNSVITPMVAAMLGLGVNEGAYLSEIVRGGISAVDEGQREAALAIGSSHFHMTRRIILPQTLRIILPTLGNETIGMLKFTSLASVVSFQELLATSEQIYYVNARVMELLIVVTVWYLVMTSVLTIAQYYLERHVGRSLQRGRPRSIVERLIVQLLESRRERRARADAEAGA